MSKFLLNALLTVALSGVAFAAPEEKKADAAKAPAKTEAKADVKADAKAEAKPEAKAEEKKADAAAAPATKEAKHHVGKEEKAKEMLAKAEEKLKEVEAKAASMAGAEKKMIEVFVAHAKLEVAAAKDPEMADHIMLHARHAKRYVNYAMKHAKMLDHADMKAEKKEEKKEEKAEKAAAKK